MTLTSEQARAMQAQRKSHKGGRPREKALQDLAGMMDTAKPLGDVVSALAASLTGPDAISAARLWLAYRVGRPTGYVHISKDQDVEEMTDEELTAIAHGAL